MNYLPADGSIVIVSGGCAMYRSGKWYSGMELPAYTREIQWEVDWWLPFQLFREDY